MSMNESTKQLINKATRHALMWDDEYHGDEAEPGKVSVSNLPPDMQDYWYGRMAGIVKLKVSLLFHDLPDKHRMFLENEAGLRCRFAIGQKQKRDASKISEHVKQSVGRVRQMLEADTCELSPVQDEIVRGWLASDTLTPFDLP